MSVCRLGHEVSVRPVDDAGLDQRPRPVADRRDRLAGLEERPRELDRLGDGPQDVGVGDAAGQNEGVVVVGVGVVDGRVDVEGVGLVEVVERLDRRPPRGAISCGLSAGLLDRLPRLGQLNLLDALVGDQERDALAFDPVTHSQFLLR